MMTPSSYTRNIVLYADDDQDDQLMVKEAFAEFDATIDLLTFGNGREVIEYLDKPSATMPCLVVLDINMPLMNGKDALAAIRERESLKNIPVVLFTTSSNPSDEIFASRHRAGFVTKPLAISDLKMIASTFISYCQDILSGEPR